MGLPKLSPRRLILGCYARLESYGVDLPGLSAWISCRPLMPAIEGGDLHYLTVCGEGAISRVVLADVAGHGDIVSGVAERLRQGLRKHVNTWDQTELLQELNDSFAAGADGVQYATAFVLGHYVESGEVLFTNAGHVPPLWYRAATRPWVSGRDAPPTAKDLLDLALGLIPGTPYTQTAIPPQAMDVQNVHRVPDGPLGLPREVATRPPVGSLLSRLARWGVGSGRCPDRHLGALRYRCRNKRGAAHRRCFAGIVDPAEATASATLCGGRGTPRCRHPWRATVSSTSLACRRPRPSAI